MKNKNNEYFFISWPIQKQKQNILSYNTPLL
jgi:hypothetical protein